MSQLVRFLKTTPWLLVALVGYYLPWIWHPAAALTFNAYDLAEWTSLSPAVRGASLPMFVPFLLRFVLCGLSILAGLRAVRADKRVTQTGYGVLAIALAITLLPPIDFFRHFGSDPNYTQQFELSVVALLALVILAVPITRRILKPSQAFIEIVLSIAMILAALMGEGLALGVVLSTGVAVKPAGGGLLLLLGMLLVIASNEVLAREGRVPQPSLASD